MSEPTAFVRDEGFRPGFVARHAAAADLLNQAFAPTPRGFAPVPVGAPPHVRPRHFSPADPGRDPTAGWNPLDPAAPATPHLDPVATAHAAGYAEGEAAGRAGVAERQATDRAVLADLATALAAAGRVDRDALARRIRQTVLHLVTRLIGEAGVSAELLVRRVTTATDLLADASESALLRLHPADLPLVDGKLPATLFAIGVALTPWDKLVAAFTVSNLIVIVSTVFTLMAVGAMVDRWLRMYPIESAIVNACHSGQGGTGDVAILTAADRMQLMPFAQIATRIGGAITVTGTLVVLSRMA